MIFAALDRNGVRYLVVGGFAAIAHGVVRATTDVDIMVDPTPENYRALSTALTRDLGPSAVEWETQFLDIDLDDEVDLARAAVFRVRTAAGVVDVINRTAGAQPYFVLIRTAELADLGEFSIPVISRAHLLEMKLAANRPKDQLDIGELLALERLEQERTDEP